MFFWLSLTPLFSLDPLEYHRSLPVLLIGETPLQAWSLAGEPNSLKLVEGALGQQVIATGHEGGVVLYWFDDRSWQISFHEPWEGSFWGLSAGMPEPEVLLRMGSPFMQTENMLVYSMPDIGFPVEARFFFDEADRLTDIFFYRSDF